MLPIKLNTIKKDFPALELLDEAFDKMINKGKVKLNIFDCETIYCFSDYAGERASDRNHVFSFLYFDYNYSGIFKSEVDKLRVSEPHWNDNSFIEYKKIPSDRVRARLLPSFLNIADLIRGYLVVIFVDKRIDSVFHYNGKIKVSKDLYDAGLGKWAPHIVEKMLQVLMFNSYFLFQFINDGQKYFWYSDRDAINDEGGPRIDYVRKLFSRFKDMLNIKGDFLGYETNFEKKGYDNYFGDIMSIPDLVAGATLEYFEEQKGVDYVKGTTDTILRWFALPSSTLQKIHFKLSKEDNKFIFSNLRWYRK
ncbi:hypothetical protein ES705_14157 [subsurface metagenome]